MSEPGEIILTTEDTGQLWTACVWDPIRGTSMMKYKGGGVAGPRSACFLGKDYVLMSNKTKPELTAWSLNGFYPVPLVELNCTGVVNAMAVTPDGFYCVTAVGNKLVVYQIASGRQLAVVERHFQPVTCVKFTDDGSHFISGGEDGKALVWALAYVVSVISGECFPEQTEPRYTFYDHGLPIQDIHVGYGGMRAYFLSVSLDGSCRIYDLAGGELKCTVFFDEPLGAVTMERHGTMAFVGASSGNIYQLDLGSPLRTREPEAIDKEKGKVFVGHSQHVTCLSISHDAKLLCSGSFDRYVIVWKISTRQIIRTIEHKGRITNAFFAITPRQMFADEFNPTLVLNSFLKESESKGSLIVKVRTKEDHWYDDEATASHEVVFPDDDKLDKLRDQIQEVTDKNEDIYKFAMEQILKPFSNPVKAGANEVEKVEAKEELQGKQKAQQKRKVSKKIKKCPPRPN